MSAFEVNRKSHFKAVRAAFDPTETLALPEDNALDAGFRAIKAFTLAAKMQPPE
jgi:hypothetical protein